MSEKQAGEARGIGRIKPRTSVRGTETHPAAKIRELFPDVR